MELFKPTLFLISALTSLACMLLLFRAYTASRRRVLLWSALCFVALTINNVLLFVDLVVLPASVDLRALRHTTALIGVLFMLYGFIRESE
jgi:hypothetical protein